MKPNGWRTLHTLAALFVLGLVPTLPAAAAEAEPQVAAIAAERLGPTSLALDVRMDYESATLRVVGPKGYEVRRRFAGGAALTADLLADRAPQVLGQQDERQRAVLAPAATESAFIPDGRYHYEAVLVDASGERKVVSGLFFVEGGVAISREAKRAQLGAVRDDLGAHGRQGGRRSVTGDALTPVTAPGSVDDYIDIYDVANDGRTNLSLESDSPVENEFWDLVNLNGDLNIQPGVGITYMFFDRGGNIGIGTSAPAQALHLVDDLRISSGAFQAELSVGNAGLWFRDDDDNSILKLNHSAPTNRLTVTGAGVGIDTETPGGNLHIFGAAGADVFNAVGPDPAIAGNALNFGYSGFTFGTGSGFFNVRPEGAPPNPALYFATGNVDRMMVDNEGFIGVHLDGVLGPGFNPSHPIHSQTSGAHLTAGGIWTNASSRELKEGIAPLDGEAALAALRQLDPVSFRYKLEPEDERVGFIAEEVPELVANPDRKTLSPMDVVAVLTRVVQEQQQTIDALREQMQALQAAHRYSENREEVP